MSYYFSTEERVKVATMNSKTGHFLSEVEFLPPLTFRILIKKTLARNIPQLEPDIVFIILSFKPF